MSEIVLAEPIHFEQGESSTSRQQQHHNHHHEYEYDYEYDNTMAITTNSVSSSSNGEQLQPGPFDSERLPTVFASEIQRFLRVANLLEREEPRVAYLCKYFFLVNSHFSPSIRKTLSL
jgi:callose synthase